jgi:ATP-binding cassette, subfamily B, bacterial PglK
MALLRQLDAVLGRRRRFKWALLVVLALILSGLEIVAAGLIYVLLILVTDSAGDVELPLVGDPTELFPAMSPEALALLVTAGIGAFFVARGAFLMLQTYAQARVVNNAGADVGTRLVRGYLSMPYALHLERNSAELVRNAFYNVETFTKSLLEPGVKLVAEVLLVLGLTAALVLISPVAMLGAVLIFGPLVWALLRAVKPRMKAYGRGAKEAESRGLSILQQGLAGIRELRISGSEGYFASLYQKTRKEFARLRTRRATLAQLPRVLIETLLVLSIAAFFIVVMQIQESGQQALSLLGLFAYVGLRLKPSIQAIVQAVNSARYATPSLEDIATDLEATASFVERRETGTEGLVPKLRRDISLEDVQLCYPNSDRPALERVDLRIERGDSIGICGPTGGGKSTLIDVIAGLLVPTAGTVEVDGVNIHDAVHSWYSQLGVVSQSVFLLDASLRENIALGVSRRDIDDAAVEQAVRLAQLEAVVAELPQGLETRVGERGIRLSGGQRQRVAIARALYRNPEVLILDEGTSALDNQTEEELVRALEHLHGMRTVILVAHRLTTVRRCNRVLVLEDGRISDEGTFDELVVRHPLFASLRPSPTTP